MGMMRWWRMCHVIFIHGDVPVYLTLWTSKRVPAWQFCSTIWLCLWNSCIIVVLKNERTLQVMHSRVWCCIQPTSITVIRHEMGTISTQSHGESSLYCEWVWKPFCPCGWPPGCALYTTWAWRVRKWSGHSDWHLIGSTDWTLVWLFLYFEPSEPGPPPLPLFLHCCLYVLYCRLAALF